MCRWHVTFVSGVTHILIMLQVFTTQAGTPTLTPPSPIPTPSTKETNVQVETYSPNPKYQSRAYRSVSLCRMVPIKFDLRKSLRQNPNISLILEKEIRAFLLSFVERSFQEQAFPHLSHNLFEERGPTPSQAPKKGVDRSIYCVCKRKRGTGGVDIGM